MPNNEIEGSEPPMNQKALLGLRKAYAKLIEERSRTGSSILHRRNGALVEISAAELLPEARRIMDDVNSQIDKPSVNGS